MEMRWLRLIGMTFLLFCINAIGASAQIDIHSLLVDSTPTKGIKDLVHQADLIVLGRPDSPDETYPTPKKVEQYRIVNYVQTLHAKKTVKGPTPRLIKVLSSGTDILPPTTSPLNKLYPGPLAEGDYICFLKKVPGTNLYSVVGGWQGVYPLLNGKTIAFKGFGFPELNGLSVEQFDQKLHSISP